MRASVIPRPQFRGHSRKATKNIRVFLILTCLSVFLVSSPAHPQSVLENEDKSWLPLTFNQSLQESLSKVAAHVTTRKGCLNVLEAKVSESSDPLNPKFIVTCSTSAPATLNFVYWLTDIESDFNGDTYLKKQEIQVFSIEEQQRLDLEKLRDENIDLTENCQTQLAIQVGKKSAHYTADDVIISQRGEQSPVVYIEYSLGESEYAPLYTATCRRDINQATQMTIFPRSRL